MSIAVSTPFLRFFQGFSTVFNRLLWKTFARFSDFSAIQLFKTLFVLFSFVENQKCPFSYSFQQVFHRVFSPFFIRLHPLFGRNSVFLFISFSPPTDLPFLSFPVFQRKIPQNHGVFNIPLWKTTPFHSLLPKTDYFPFHPPLSHISPDFSLSRLSKACGFLLWKNSSTFCFPQLPVDISTPLFFQS